MQAYRPRTHRLGIGSGMEPLEERLCLTVSVAVIDLGNGFNMLRITGDGDDDVINIADDGDGHIDVTDGAAANLGSADNVRAIRVESRAGEDTVNFDVAAALAHNLSLSVDLGAGDDVADFDLSDGIDSVDFRLNVLGGGGVDIVGATIGDINDAYVKLKFDGAGNDDDLSAVIGDVSDAELYLDFAGGSGLDSLTSTIGDITEAKVHVYMDGGSGSDTLESEIGEATAAKVEISQQGGAGDDIIDSTVGSLTDAKVSVKMEGNAGDDTMTATAVDVGIEESSELSLKLDGGANDDEMTTNYSGLLGGKLHYQAYGGSGIDTVVGELTVAANSTGRLRALTSGGPGVDANVTLNVTDNTEDGAGNTGLALLRARLFNPNNEDPVVNTDNVEVITDQGQGPFGSAFGLPYGFLQALAALFRWF